MKEFIEKLIGRLEEERAKGIYDIDNVITVKDAYRKAISIVNQLAEEYNNGWIPCSKDLPEDRIDVLVWHSDLDMCCVAWYNSVTKNWYSNDFEFADSKYVAAWQPLPAPYQPKGE